MLDTLAKTKKAIGGVISIILVGLLIFYLGVRYASNANEPKITSTGLTQTLQNIEELATVQYNYTKVGKFSNSLQFNGWNIPLTQKNFLITYDGSLRAGIKMNQIEVKVLGNNIKIILPKAEILSNEIDESSIEVYDESANIFNPIKIDDYTTFALEQKKLVEQEAIENKMLEEAEVKAQRTILNYVTLLPGVANNYNIEIEFVED